MGMGVSLSAEARAARLKLLWRFDNPIQRESGTAVPGWGNPAGVVRPVPRRKEGDSYVFLSRHHLDAAWSGAGVFHAGGFRNGGDRLYPGEKLRQYHYEKPDGLCSRHPGLLDSRLRYDVRGHRRAGRRL